MCYVFFLCSFKETHSNKRTIKVTSSLFHVKLTAASHNSINSLLEKKKNRTFSRDVTFFI